MHAIEQLLAIEQIKILKAQYFRFVDTKNWDGLRSIFTDDAVLEFPESTTDSKNINDAMTFIKDAVEGAVSIHFGHMPEISILSENLAQGVWAMDDRIYWPDEKATALGYCQLRGFGHYHESYQRVDGAWKIRALRLTRLRLVAQQPPLRVD